MIPKFFTIFAVTLFSFILCACHKPMATSKTAYELSFSERAAIFTESHALEFNSQGAIENSLVRLGDQVLAFFDPNMNGDFFRASLGTDGKHFSKQEAISSGIRFPYTLAVGTVLYNFCLQNQDIYAYKSIDSGFTWKIINNGNPVLSHESSPNSIYNQIWNVGVAIDDQGLWHMLVECSIAGNDPAKVGLAYTTAIMDGDTISFDPSKTNQQVIQRAGNPFLTYIKGQGLLALHGVTADPTVEYGDEWFVTASTHAINSTKWIEHKDTFRIGKPGVHVCDPHLVELPSGGLMLTVSVNQDSISTAFAPRSTYQDLIRSLIK